MALGDIQWLQWKTKRGQAKDDEEYAAWEMCIRDRYEVSLN